MSTLQELCYYVHIRNETNLLRRRYMYNSEKQDLWKAATEAKRSYKFQIKAMAKELGYKLVYDTNGYVSMVLDKNYSKILLNGRESIKEQYNHHMIEKTVLGG